MRDCRKSPCERDETYMAHMPVKGRRFGRLDLNLPGEIEHTPATYLCRSQYRGLSKNANQSVGKSSHLDVLYINKATRC